MENRDGAIYTPTSASNNIEQLELRCTARVLYTGAASIEEVDPALLAQLSAVLIRRCQFGADQLALLPSLRCVLRMGAGFDNIDTDACTAAGVVACNCPDAWVEVYRAIKLATSAHRAVLLLCNIPTFDPTASRRSQTQH